MIKKGDKGAPVLTLQKGLMALGFSPGQPDGIFGPATELAVERFQKEKRLLVDGIVGRVTAETYNFTLMNSPVPQARDMLLLFDVEKPISETEGEKMRFVRCPADVFEDRKGYTRLTLREDAAEAFQALYDEVHDLGGIITSAGGKRSFRQASGPNRSRRSLHYLGIAFDMALPTGMYKPEEDPFIIVQDGKRHWQVFCRTENPGAEIMELDATICRRARNAKGKVFTKVETQKVITRVFNFTEVAKKHGFERIGARSSFFRGGSYGGAEWWHFQFEKALTPGKSKFGEELLKVYSLEECQKFQYWNEVKNSVWKKEWF